MLAKVHSNKIMRYEIYDDQIWSRGPEISSHLHRKRNLYLSFKENMYSLKPLLKITNIM